MWWRKKQEIDTKPIELELNIIIAEYNVLRSLIQTCREMQVRMDNLALSGLGVTVTALIYISEYPKSYQSFYGAFLIAPIVLLLLTLAQIRLEYRITQYASYIHKELRPRTNLLLQQANEYKQAVTVFNFDNFLGKQDFMFKYVLRIAFDSSLGSIALVSGFALLIFTTYFRCGILSSLAAYWHCLVQYERVFVSISFLLFFADILLIIIISSKKVILTKN